MRSFITAILLFVILIASVTANALYINSVCSKIDATAESLTNASNKQALISELKSLWKKNVKIFNLSIRVNEIERMNDLIESLSASYDAQNDAEFKKYCTLISELAQDLAHYETLSFRSIF